MRTITETCCVLAVVLLAGCQTTSRLEHTPPAGLGESEVVLLRLVPGWQLPERCGLSPERLVGCSFPQEEPCVVYVAEELPPALRAEVLTHERAHCAGWTHQE